MSLSKIYCRSTNCTMYIKCRQRIFFSLFNSFPLFKQIFGNKICQLGQNSYKRKVYWELYRGFPFIFITEHSHLYECPISKKYGQAAWKSKRIWCREKQFELQTKYFSTKYKTKKVFQALQLTCSTRLLSNQTFPVF